MALELAKAFQNADDMFVESLKSLANQQLEIIKTIIKKQEEQGADMNQIEENVNLYIEQLNLQLDFADQVKAEIVLARTQTRKKLYNR
jgi:hypothetical protein